MPEPEWESPWSQFAEEQRASARRYNDLCDRLGLAVRGAQQEAYETWCAGETQPEEMGEVEREEPVAAASRGTLVAVLVAWAYNVRRRLSERARVSRRAWVPAAATAAVAFAVGLVVRPVLLPPAIHTDGYTITKPSYAESPQIPGLGVGPSVHPEAVHAFKEAMALYSEPDFADRATSKLREAVAIDPNFEQAQFWLGVALLLKGNAAAAVPHLEAARRFAPGKTEYGQYLLWAYLRNGLVEKAFALQTELLERR